MIVYAVQQRLDVKWALNCRLLSPQMAALVSSFSGGLSGEVAAIFISLAGCNGEITVDAVLQMELL